MIGRLLTSIISALIFTLTFILILSAGDLSNSAFIPIFLYAVVVYILGGVPSSLFIEKLIQETDSRKKFIYSFVLYGVFGVLVVFLFLIAISKGSIISEFNPTTAFRFSIIGVAAAEIYLFVLLGIKKIIKQN